MRNATYACPDLTTFCRLDELGLVVVGQRLDPDRAVLACRGPGTSNGPTEAINGALHNPGCSRGLNPPDSRSDLAM